LKADVHRYPTEPGQCSRWLTLVLALTLAGCSTGSAESTRPPTTASPPPETTATTATAPPPPPTTSSTTTSSTTTSAGVAAGGNYTVPVAATAPTIDGVLAPGEWDAATTATMSDGAAVHLLHFDGNLYVAVAGNEIGAVNVILGIDDAVWILHSSAALGSALYSRGSESWQLDHGFRWCCRSTSDSSDRDQLFAAEGWQANIGYSGEPGIVEYQIALPWVGAAAAISTIRDDDDKGFWPPSLSPAAREQLLGVPPQERIFNVAEWPRIGD
jgi:hypothetical protein